MFKEYKLGGVGIFTHVAREMAKGHHYDNMRLLLQYVEKTDLCNDDAMDEILGACLLVVIDDKNEVCNLSNHLSFTITVFLIPLLANKVVGE